MSHLEDGLIQELLDGEVHSRDLPPIQAHLASCAACAARLEEARALAGEADELIAALDEDDAAPPTTAPVPDIAPPHRVATWPRTLAWAASLVLAVGLGYTARGGLVPPPTSPTTTAAEQVTAPATSPTNETDPAVADRPVERLADAAPRPAPRMAEPEATRQEPAARALTQPERRDADPSAAGAVASPEANRLELAAPAPAASVGRAARQRVAAADEAASGASREVAKATSAPVRTADSTGTPSGPLFLISGIAPLRFDISDTEARVVYRTVDGEVALVQRRLGERVTWHLEASAGFPPESLAVLRQRVR